MLGDDDDKNVMDIDIYIGMMMEDGRYRGDVELNTASKLYRRNIKIYSEKYGVCPPIECENAEGDFVLSYRQMRCGENHYNSAFRPAKEAAIDELMQKLNEMDLDTNASKEVLLSCLEALNRSNEIK